VISFRPDPVDYFTLAFGVGFAALATAVSGEILHGLSLGMLNLAVGLLALWLLPHWRAASAARRFFGVALPLLVFYLFYREAALVLSATDVAWRDRIVAALEWTRWENASRPGGPAALGELSAFGYMAYVPLLLLVTVALLSADPPGPHGAAETYIRQVCLAWAVCYVIFLAIPVLGPRMAFPTLQDTRLGTGPFSALARLNQERGMIRGGAFPSAHVAATLIACWHAWRHARRIFWIALAPALALVGGAVYLGYHYAVDVVAGTAVAVAVVALEPALVGQARRTRRAGGPVTPSVP